jgi:hypothetical protein
MPALGQGDVPEPFLQLSQLILGSRRASYSETLTSSNGTGCPHAAGQHIMMDRPRMPLDVRFVNPTSWRGAVGRHPKLLSSTRPGRQFNNG